MSDRPKVAQDRKESLDDQTIVDLYWARDERAIKETDIKYQKYLSTVLHNILHDRLDCEECLNDTYSAAWESMPPVRPRTLKAFLTVIARRVAIDRYYSNNRKGRLPSEMTVSLSEVEHILEAVADPSQAVATQHLGDFLSAFVRSLSHRKRFIYMSRYYASESIDAIAETLGVSCSTVNRELAAIRDTLKQALEKEDYII